jgi:hypothetical protein
MIEPSELDMAQLRHEFRQLYMSVGYTGSLQALYEMLVAASTLGEVIAEERRKEEQL